MEEDISIIDTNTKIEKIKNFLNKNKKYLIVILSLIIIIIFAYFAYGEIQNKKNKNLAEKYNDIIVNFELTDKSKFKKELIEIIYEKNETYSPLALYFIIDNEIKSTNQEINEFFDVIINETKLDKEIKNLIIYKKGLFNSEFKEENELLNILKPVLNSDSEWKVHSLYLLAEFFYFKKNKSESKKLLNEILNYENSNPEIKLEAQKKLTRDFSE